MAVSAAIKRGIRSARRRAAFTSPSLNRSALESPFQHRAIGRTALDRYFDTTNYVSSWKRLGFTDADVTRPGSNKLIDAVVAHGTPQDIATRLGEYLSAGANHVAILVHGGSEKVLPTLSELAGPLGLSG